MTRSTSRRVVRALLACTLAAAAAPSAHAGVKRDAAGVSSAGVPIACSVTFTITGDTLRLVLRNDSTTPSQNPNDLIASLYFDIINASGQRPALTYLSATGDVWLTSRTSADTLVRAAADVMAVDPGDRGWQFRAMNPAFAPFLGFGLGTVGNAALSPNNFNGSIVGGRDYSIAAGEITTANLNGDLLVKDGITFVFSGVSGFSEADISLSTTFGLGTAPDSLNTVPAPASGVLAAIGGGLLVRRRRR